MKSAWMAVAVMAACGGKGTRPPTVANAGGEAAKTGGDLGKAIDPDPEGETFEADLDGDGKAEKVEYGCEGDIWLSVDGVKVPAEEKVQFGELMGCWARVVSMWPGNATRQVIVTGQEHEEVGPPTHVMFAFADGKARPIWQQAGEITLHEAGWTVTTTNCEGDGDELATYVATMRWSGGEVDEQFGESRDKVDYDCNEGP